MADHPSMKRDRMILDAHGGAANYTLLWTALTRQRSKPEPTLRCPPIIEDCIIMAADVPEGN